MINYVIKRSLTSGDVTIDGDHGDDVIINLLTPNDDTVDMEDDEIILWHIYIFY